MRFKRKKTSDEVPVQTSSERVSRSSLLDLDSFVPSSGSLSVYEALRESVPIIDAAITKTVRLTGGYEVHCKSPEADNALQSFIRSVPVGGNGEGLYAFMDTYFNQLLTFGTAVGEMVVQGGKLTGLYNAPLRNIELHRSADGFGCEVWTGTPVRKPVRYPELLLVSALNPVPGKLGGTSLLHGLPFVSSVLLKIYNAVGCNWDRVGNVRFAVTYKPSSDAADRAYAKERAVQVAKQWSEAMQSGNKVKDFVTVGDVSIKVIGAESPIPDSDIPVRQMLEQIVAKTGIPPFMLGLSWSSTERMSAQQADVLTSELESYRRLLTPVIAKICRTFLRLNGFCDEPVVEWEDITLQDEVELARARLYDAQAKQILNKKEETA